MAVPGSVLIDTDTSTPNILFKRNPARAVQVNKSISHHDISSQSDPRRSEVSPGGKDLMQSDSDDDDEGEEENKISVADIESSNINTDIILSPPSPPPASDNHTTAVTPPYHVVEPPTPEHPLSTQHHSEQSGEQKARRLDDRAAMAQVDTSSLIGKYIFCTLKNAIFFITCFIS